MDRAGERLKRAREHLKLTYREVEQASQRIAMVRANDEFAIPLSRLADIENKGTLPTIYRIYTLCSIYRLDFDEVLHWYGVPKDQIAAESLQIALAETHIVQFSDGHTGTIPEPSDFEIDLNKTSFLSQFIRRWGKLPLAFLNGLDLKQHRYGFVGMDDWSMYPILQPGSLVAIDESQRKISNGGWSNEFDRPIYFLEHRNGYACSWCVLEEDRLLLQPHPASSAKLRIFAFPAEVDVIGQVIGVAMLLESRHHRRRRTAGAPVRSPGL